MVDLVQSMKVVLANYVSFKIKSQAYHWNVEGSNFVQLHQFFQTLYEDSDSATDEVAEKIRTLGAYAPGSLTRFSELTEIEDEKIIPDAINMARNLLLDNETIIASLIKARDEAESLRRFGIVSYLEQRIDIQSKHSWMLKAIIK